jgi:hypothetical protein
MFQGGGLELQGDGKIPNSKTQNPNKFQIPTSKIQTNSKHQNPGKFQIKNFQSPLGFGIWML